MTRCADNAFVDESQRSRLYLVVAAIVEPTAVSDLRAQVRSLLLPGQRELHFKKEKPARRRMLADEIARWPVEVTVYARSYGRRPEPARQECLHRLLVDLVERQADGLVIDSRDHQDRSDEGTIRDVLRANSGRHRLNWGHADSASELLLALPDIAAWCYGAGGVWRERIEPILANVIDLNGS